MSETVMLSLGEGHDVVVHAMPARKQYIGPAALNRDSQQRDVRHLAADGRA